MTVILSVLGPPSGDGWAGWWAGLHVEDRGSPSWASGLQDQDVCHPVDLAHLLTVQGHHQLLEARLGGHEVLRHPHRGVGAHIPAGGEERRGGDAGEGRREVRGDITKH